MNKYNFVFLLCFVFHLKLPLHFTTPREKKKCSLVETLMITDEIGDKHEERNKGKSRDGKLTLKRLFFSLTTIQEEKKAQTKMDGIVVYGGKIALARRIGMMQLC